MRTQCARRSGAREGKQMMDFARARLVTLRLKGGEKKRKETRRVSSSRIGFTEILFLSNSRAAEFLHSEATLKEGHARSVENAMLSTCRLLRRHRSSIRPMCRS